MIYGHINAPDAYSFLLSDPIWAEAFNWIRSMPAQPEARIHPIRGDDMFVNVHGYDTLPREQCRFESHRKYLDLQYCIEGGENIEWKLSSTLEPAGAFHEAKDLQFYNLAEPGTSLRMSPGSFAIFFPSDAHLPKISDGVNPKVFKLVVKINRTLLGR